MKIFLLCLYLSISAVAYNQTPVAVPGTKYSLVPPPGFVLAAEFSGFKNDGNASIVLVEIPAPYNKIAETLTAEALQVSNIKLLSSKPIDFNNTKALLLSVEQSAGDLNFRKKILVFGNATTTVMVNGIYPASSPEQEAPLLAAIMTTTYSQDQAAIKTEAVKFTLDVSDSDFKPAQNAAGSILYTTTGSTRTNGPTLIAANSVSPVTGSDKKQYATDRFRKIPGADTLVINQTNPITINGLSGYEIIAYDKVKKILLYQVMVFTEQKGYLVLLGRTNEKLTEYLSSFKKIAGTLALK